MLGKVEQILLLDVFSLDVHELVSVRSVHFVQEPDGGSNRVSDSLPLEIDVQLCGFCSIIQLTLKISFKSQLF